MATTTDTVNRFLQQGPPTDVVGLIDALGIEYRERAMPAGDSGRILRTPDDRYVIEVNANEHPQRKRFTAAHELGHYVLHQDSIDQHSHLDRLFDEAARRNPETPLSHAQEVQANRFAAEMLMPTEVVRRHYDPETDNVREIARMCQVSPNAARIRLHSLGFRTTPD